MADGVVVGPSPIGDRCISIKYDRGGSVVHHDCAPLIETRVLQCCAAECVLAFVPDTTWGLGDTSRVENGFGPGVLCAVTGLVQAPLPSETVVSCAFGAAWTRCGGGEVRMVGFPDTVHCSLTRYCFQFTVPPPPNPLAAFDNGPPEFHDCGNHCIRSMPALAGKWASWGQPAALMSSGFTILLCHAPHYCVYPHSRQTPMISINSTSQSTRR